MPERNADKIVVILPTYNEAGNIARAVEEIRKACPHVHLLVVDDESPDGTADIVRSLQKTTPSLELILDQTKQGLKQAYQRGFEWALAQGYDYAVEMDADLSHAPEDLKRLLEARHPHTFVVGSRYVNQGKTQGWPLSRLWLSQFGNLFARTVLQSSIRDLTAGFVVWSREILRQIITPPPDSEGYAFQIELKHRAARLGYSCTEVPITFRERVEGASKMSAKIALEALIAVPRIRLSIARNPAAKRTAI